LVTGKEISGPTIVARKMEEIGMLREEYSAV